MEDKDYLYACEMCKYKTNRKSNMVVHKSSKKHTEKLDNTCQETKHKCTICNYNTNSSSHYKRHLRSKRHMENKIVCQSPPQEEKSTGIELTQEMFMELINHNKKLMEVVQNGTNSMTNCHNNNNTNTFNLQVFLNETCKDAINMKDFVNSIEVTIGDLKNLGRRGYVDSISSLMIKKLNDLDVTKRPIHSSDVKRETLYIKDNGTWEKDNDQKERLRKVLWDITRLKTCALEEKYKLMYPQVETDRDSKEHNEYWKIFHNAMGGDAGSVDHLQSKVIKRVVQNVAINKDLF